MLICTHSSAFAAYLVSAANWTSWDKYRGFSSCFQYWRSWTSSKALSSFFYYGQSISGSYVGHYVEEVDERLLNWKKKHIFQFTNWS